IFIESYPDDILLCPFNSMQTLLSRTTPWHTTSAQQRSLFLITRVSHTPAATDMITGWIKSVIRLSSTTSSAKDMRPLSAFFLQRDIKIMIEKNHSSSLILNEANSVGYTPQ